MSSQTLRELMRAALVAQLCLLVFFIAYTHNAFRDKPKPTTTDFASFYAAGALAARGEAASAYKVAPLQQAEEAITAPGIGHVHFLNPPAFLMICAPLAHLPYLLAFILFELVTGLLWLAVTTRIAGGGSLVVLSLLAFPAVFWTAGWGQNSFLTASLMGLGTLLLRRRPGLAGAAFGALVIKPHFGVLIPLALLAGRHWRAVLTAGASSVGLILLSMALFGLGSWSAFFDMALHSARQAIESGAIDFAGRIDPGGAARLLGAGTATGWRVQAIATLVAACIVGFLWWRRNDDPRAADGAYEARMAALVSGTMIAMPFLLFYDLVMASVAVAWLVSASRRLGWLPGEQAWFAAVFTLTLLAFLFAAALHLAIGCLVAPCLLGLSVRRWLAARQAGEGPGPQP